MINSYIHMVMFSRCVLRHMYHHHYLQHHLLCGCHEPQRDGHARVPGARTYTVSISVSSWQENRLYGLITRYYRVFSLFMHTGGLLFICSFIYI